MPRHCPNYHPIIVPIFSACTASDYRKMETLVTTTGVASVPIFCPSKSRDPSSWRLLRFSTSPKNDNSSNYNGEIHHESESADLAPILRTETLSKDAAMGLVLSAANVRGWTTGSGMEGPPVPASSDADSDTERVSTFPWLLFSKSPRRRMRVIFTCNFCGQRTTRAINPHAYTDGTVFVQCCGCNIFHKLVDNLNLFHGIKCYVNSSFNPNPNWNTNASFTYFNSDEDNNGDIFPLI